MADIDVIGSIPNAQLSRPWNSLSAVQYVRRMRGQTQAHLMRTSDSGLFVVKFQNNPHTARVLASEFLATRLGLWLGLPMPQAEIIEVSEWLVNHALLRIENEDKLTRCASGRQLGCQYISNTLDTIPRRLSERLANSSDLVRVLAFDKWTANCDDRQIVLTKNGRQGRRAMFIDQHQCFDAGRWSFPDLPFHGTYADAHVYKGVTGWHWFEPTLSRIEKISRFDLWKLATEIPPEWYQHDTAALSRLIERLYRRRSTVRELIGKFRDSSITPFPHWRKV